MERLIADRIKKLESIKELGINPYPHIFKPKQNLLFLKKKYSLPPSSETNDFVKVAGRIILFRRMGKLTFLTIMDEHETLQVVAEKNSLNENYELVKKLDIGDFIGVEGKIITTKTGELSIKANKITLLSKSIRPLPEKHHGIQDKELRYRKRYLDLIINKKVRDLLRKRSLINKYIREFMDSKGFLEVETPILQTQYGGANARPFITHINAWDMKMYLSISPELYLKRLIVGGYEKVYTICKNFRNEGVDHSHNPEFTMMEAYQAYADYNDMMKLTEELYEFVALKINGTTKVKRVIDGKEITIDLKAPWPRKTMAEVIEEELNINVLEMSIDELKEFLNNNNIDYEPNITWGDAVLIIFDELIEHKILGPIHIIDRPRESSPLCKTHRRDERLIEQNEPIIFGMEVANMYSELNDPLLQRKLLEEQAKALRAGSEESHPMDEDFVQAIETGMPPTGGLGIGIDRMAIILLGQESIRDVLLFPIMKPLGLEEKDKKNKENKEKE